MALNLLPTAEINPSVSFFNSRKSTTNLFPKPPGGIRLKRRGLGAVGRRIILCLAQQSPPPTWPGSAFPEAGRRTWDGPKPISIIGSTGSIRTQTLDIIVENPNKFRVVALATGSNVTLLANQVRRFKPQLVLIRNESLVVEIKEALADVGDMPEIIHGEQGIIEVGYKRSC